MNHRLLLIFPAAVIAYWLLGLMFAPLPPGGRSAARLALGVAVHVLALVALFLSITGSP